MDKKKKPETQINIFALPNQTTILFIFIIVVFLVPVTLGSLTSTPLVIWPLVLGILIIPLRAILKRPEREFECHDLTPAGEEFEDLNAAILTYAETINLRHKPKLMVSPHDLSLYTFGSFRHQYIAVGKKAAKIMQAQLADPETSPVVSAQIIHELYHFKTGDHWQLGYAGELLRTNFSLMAWAVAFFLGIGFLSVLAVHDFLEFDMQAALSQMEFTPDVKALLSQMYLSPEQIAEMRERASQVNWGLVLTFAISTTWPFAALGLTIWTIYWPRLWRMREFYANAGMVYEQKQIMPALAVVTHLPLPILRQQLDDVVIPQKHNRHIFAQHRGWQKIRENFENIRMGGDFQQVIKDLRCSLDLFSGGFHTSNATQIATLLNPCLVFDDWKSVAVLVGSLMILLEMLLLTPLTYLMVGNWPMHFVTLATVVLVALNYLIPAIASGKPVRDGLLKIIGVVGGIRFVIIAGIILTLVFMLFVLPDTLYEVLCVAIANVAGYAGELSTACYEDISGFVMEAAIKNIAQAIVVPLLTIVALMVISFLVRRVFTWYGFPNAEKRLMRVVYGCIIVVCLFFGFTVLPFVTDLILRPLEIFNITTLAIEFLGFLIAVAAGVLFVRVDRKYAHRCPNCGASLPGDFSPGKRCCDEILHSWLVMEYDL